jgi:putative peptide zinc metalloprotease protein
MSDAYPELRQDLVVSQTGQGEDIAYVIKDPVTRKFFRLKAPEYFIARRFDGSTSLEEIAAAYERQFDALLSRSSLEQFVNRMRELCLLERGLSKREIAGLQRKAGIESRLLNRLLQLRLRAVDPDGLLRAVLPWTRFFFTWQFVVATSVLTLAAVGITIFRWDMYTAQARALVRPGAIPTFVLVAMVVTVLHELAHGLACRHYGGEVHEIGFLLIYLVPAFYCNVSDAWLFPEKSKRIWVSAAGTFFQVLIYAVAAILWLFVDPASRLSQVCAMTIAVAGLTALFNFNPLIKLDGYYMLSDYLEIPNLRRKAFAHLWAQARRLLGLARGGGGGDRGAGAPDATRRERLIYLAYGLSAGGYSVGLLVFVVYQIADFIVSALS